jgi:hypothetical protein
LNAPLRDTCLSVARNSQSEPAITTEQALAEGPVVWSLAEQDRIFDLVDDI